MPPLPHIYCFITPFASQAALKHARKLLDCLLPSPPFPDHHYPNSLPPSPSILYALCDRRLALAHPPLPFTHIPLPSLCYLDQRKPLLSAIFWSLNLLRILICSVFHLLRLAPRVDLVICSFGAWYTPILITARLLRKKTLIFEPGGEFAAAQAAYHHNRFWPLLSFLLLFATTLNRRLAHRIVIESPAVIPFAGLEPYRCKLRFATLYLDPALHRSPHPIPSIPPLVGFFGRLSSEKGILSLLNAALLIDPCEASFLIAGDGPLRPEVESRLASPRLRHVRCVGWLSPSEIPAFLDRLSLFVLPSAGEGIPNAVLEAMACGVPVLAAPVGGLNDLIIHGSTGYLLPDTSPATIAASICRLLPDPARPMVARRARKLVLRRYSLTAARRGWRSILSELLSDP